MGEGKTFSDAYNTPEEERRRRAREAAKQAPQTQRPQNTQYVNGLVSGGGVRAQEDRRREVARNAARQQVQNPIGGFLSGVLSKGKDVVDLAQKGVEFNVDLLKNPEKLVDAGETARKAIINATPPAQLYNRIRTDQRVQKNRQEVDQAEQRINSQLKEQTGGQVSDLTSAIKTLSARRSELSPEGKKSLLSLLDINRQLAGARQQTEEVNLQNVDPVGILEDALFTGGQPVADMARELSARGGARIVKELEDNRLAKAMVPFIGETSKGIDIAQGSNLGKFVFGRGKVDKASDDIKSFTKDIPILRDIFKYAPLATAGGIAINLPGIGGTSKVGKLGKASKELSLVDNVDDVVKVIGKYDDLNKLFGEVDDTLKPILLERLAKETKPKEIQKTIRGSLEATKRLQLEAPQAGKTDSLESLKAEARKYKSAEEFVEAQGKPLYHGTPNPELVAKNGLRTNPKGRNFLGEGVYITPHKFKAENYSLPQDLPRGSTITQEMRDAGVIDAYIAKDTKIWKPESRAELQTLDKNDLQRQGYDGIELNGEIVVFNPNKVKTKQQLTDLYNQAKTVAPVESKGVDSTLDELQNLQPEEIAKIDDLAKQAGFAGLDDVAQSLKPKAVSNISEATPSKAPVGVVSDVKNEVALAPRTTDEAVREIAGALGRDIGEVDESLGTSAKAISAVTGGKFTNTRKLNPFRLLSDYLGGGVAKQGEKAITGKGSKTLRGIEGFFGGAGRTADVKQIPRQFEGRLANIGDLVGKANKESNRILDSIKDARKQLDLVMRDNAYIKRVYGDGAEKLSPDNLPPKLKKVYEQYTDANKVVNDINLQTKVIDKAQWLGGTKGQHIARKFDIPKGEKEVIRDHVRALFDQTAGVKRKDISKFEDELIALLDKDPIKAIEFRTEMALRNLAFTEALDGFKANDFIKNVAPNKGFIQMTGKRWGKYDGKFIERGAYEQLSGNRQFLSDMSTSFNNLLETYQRSGIGQLDRIQKAFKTTLNAGTSVGNLLSNPFLFNLGAGTNPVTQLYDMAGAFKQMRKGMSEGNVYLARELGVIGGDTGRILTGSSNKAASALGDATIGLPRKVLNKAGQIYGGIDDVAKLGLFNRLVKKGVDPQEAAQEVARFTQDYNQVGRTVQLIADMPVVGKPFARFSPELVRIIKNNVTRAPHRIIAGVAGLAYLNNRLSKDANETDEERRTREDAVGQTMIPGTAWINKQMGGPERDVSLNIPINDSAVNIARMVGLNFPIEPGIDPSRALLEQLIPVEIPIRKNAIGETVFDPTKIVTSMTFRPIIEQVFDQNFMDKKISDPTNVTYDSQGNVMKNTPPSTKDQLINRGLAFGASVLPMGYEATSIGSSIAGRPGPTGKNRSVIDSVLRSIGLKAERNDPEARAKRTDTANFFEVTKPAQDKFLQENKDLESLYFQVYPKTKDRNTGKKISDQISPEKWAKVSAEKSGRLFEFMKSQAIEANKRDKTQPIDPIYKLKKDQAREVLRLRARPTGDDVEREQILRANTDWYPKLEKNERAYYKDLSKYFDKLKKEGVDIDSSLNDRVKKYNNVKYPAQPKLLKDYYKISNKDQAKAYLKQFDKDWVSSQFDKDSANRLEYVNAKRAIEGAPPISKKVWDNVTFGYEDDEDKVATKLYFKNKGKGYDYGSSGKGGKGGKSGKTAKDKRVPLSSLTSYIRGLGTDIPDVASQIRAPEVRLRLPSPAPSRAKRVTIKFR